MKRMAVNLSGELVELAKRYAKVEKRSLAKQIEYWAKIGCQAEAHPFLTIAQLKLHMVEEELTKAAQEEPTPPKK